MEHSGSTATLDCGLTAELWLEGNWIKLIIIWIGQVDLQFMTNGELTFIEIEILTYVQVLDNTIMQLGIKHGLVKNLRENS